MYVTLIAMLANDYKNQFGFQITDQCFGYYELFWHKPCYDINFVKPKMTFINEEFPDTVSDYTNKFTVNHGYRNVYFI